MERETDSFRDVSLAPFVVLAATQGRLARRYLDEAGSTLELRREANARVKASDEFVANPWVDIVLNPYYDEPTVPLERIRRTLRQMMVGLDQVKTPGMQNRAKQAIERLLQLTPEGEEVTPKSELLIQISKLAIIDQLYESIMEYNERVLIPRLADASSPDEKDILLKDAAQLAKYSYAIRRLERTLAEGLQTQLHAAQDKNIIHELRSGIGGDRKR